MFGQDWTENKKKFIIGQKVVRSPFLKNAASSRMIECFFLISRKKEKKHELQLGIIMDKKNFPLSPRVNSQSVNYLIIFQTP